MPQITVCIPTYNRAHFLRESIPSVLAQTYTDLQILVSDNASTDNTAEVVASFQDTRIVYYRQAENIGLTGNLRSVIERAIKANTEYVAILSDDDLFLHDHLATAITMLKAYPQAAYYSCPATRFGDDGVTGTLNLGGKAPVAANVPAIYVPPQDAFHYLGVDTPGPLMTMVCRTQAFHERLFWGPPNYLPIDLLLMTQLMVQGGFVFGNRATALYRSHGGNVSHPSHNRRAVIRMTCMEWFGIRWLTQFLLEREMCTLADIEAHGLRAVSPDHVVPLVIALGSFDSPPPLRAVAKRVFQTRRDMDAVSARFRVARRVGFSAIPFAEKMSQIRSGWRP
jgi:glycosyltransferase involved in cell wall biosynthesis